MIIRRPRELNGSPDGGAPYGGRRPKRSYRRFRAPLPFLLLMFLAATLYAQEGDEELDRFFEDVFGVSPDPVEQPVRLLLDGMDYGIVTALVTPAGRLTALDTGSLVSRLEELLNEGGREAIEGAAADAQIVTVEDLAEAGISVDYDRVSLLATLTVPGSYRRPRELSIRRSPGRGELPEGVPVAAPAPVAGGSVIGGSIVRRTLSLADETSWSGTIDMKPFISAFDWLLRGDFDLLIEEGRSQTTVSNLFLRRLWPEAELTLTIGDVLPGTGFFQSGRRIQGVELRRDIESDGVLGDPLAEFTLDEPQEVELAVNRDVIFQQRLGPGSYEVVDVPLGTGISEVAIRFPDTDLPVIELSRPYQSALLPVGEQEYSHALGITPLLWNNEANLDEFSADELRASSLHRYGFTPTLTGSAGAQLSPEAGQLLLAGDTATMGGNVGVSTALSISQSRGFGFGARSSYELFLPAVPVRPSLRFSAGWIGEALSDPDRPDGRGELPLQFTLAYGQRIAGGYTGTLRSSLFLEPRESESAYRVSLNLTSPRVGDARLALRLDYESESGNPSGWSGFGGAFTVRVTPRRGPRVTTTQAIAEPRSNLSVEESGLAPGAGQYAVSAEGSQSWEREMPLDRLALSGRLSGRRGVAAGGSSWVFDSGGALSSSSLTIAGETGLLFAGDQFAWSRVRPGESFAIVALEEGEELSQVSVGSGTGAVTVSPGFRGSLAVQNRDPYDPIFLTLNPGSLPLGYELTNPRVIAETGLGTGTVVTPELRGIVFARGVLVDPQSTEPLTLIAGRVYPVDEPDASRLVFSNRQGRFEAGGLTEGSYRFEAADGRIAEFTIPEGSAGLVDLGELEVE